MREGRPMICCAFAAAILGGILALARRMGLARR
jgi:hypothetical protein